MKIFMGVQTKTLSQERFNVERMKHAKCESLAPAE
jgi:hypothetical protein